MTFKSLNGQVVAPGYAVTTLGGLTGMVVWVELPGRYAGVWIYGEDRFRREYVPNLRVEQVFENEELACCIESIARLGGPEHVSEVIETLRKDGEEEALEKAIAAQVLLT